MAGSLAIVALDVTSASARIATTDVRKQQKTREKRRKKANNKTTLSYLFVSQ
jgi:heme exporter protein D